MLLTLAGVRRLQAALLAATTVVVGLSAIAYFVVDRTVNEAHFVYWYVGSEYNFPTWWNSTLFALVGATALIPAILYRAERVAWGCVVAAGLFLSADESSRIHERAGILVRDVETFVPTFNWVILGAAVSVVAFIVMLVITRTLPRGTRIGLAASFGTFVLAAVGLEAVSGFVFKQGSWGGFLVLTHIEEWVEMAVCAVAIGVTLRRCLPLSVETHREDVGPQRVREAV